MDHVPITIKQGDTWDFTVQWLQPIPGTTRPDVNNPVDITGYTARVQVRRNPGAPDPPALALTSSPAAGLTVTGLTGTVVGRATPAQTTGVAAGRWRWECEITNGTDTRTLAGGPLLVEAQVVV